MKEELQRTFEEMEQAWLKPRLGAEAATQKSVDRINRGKTVIFVYPWASPEKVDEIMQETGAKGQFDLPFDGDSLLHVKI